MIEIEHENEYERTMSEMMIIFFGVWYSFIHFYFINYTTMVDSRIKQKKSKSLQMNEYSHHHDDDNNDDRMLRYSYIHLFLALHCFVTMCV